MSRNPERVDRVEMFGKAEPGLCCVGPGFSLSTCAVEPKESQTGAGVLLSFAEEVAEQVVEEEASSAVEEWESCGDVDAGRVAGETAPWTVNPTPMMLDARLSTCREVSDNARRRMVLRS